MATKTTLRKFFRLNARQLGQETAVIPASQKEA